MACEIAVVVGSIRKDSFNKQLADALAGMAPPDFSFVRVCIDDLPLYSQDDDASPADSVKRVKTQIASAQGLLFVTPEYNRSMPWVLKNAIDDASRPYGQSVWGGKPAGSSASRWARSARRWCSSICATCWPT